MSATVASRPSALRALADRVGIVPEYVDQTGKEKRVTSDDTRVALLAALGIDASTDERAQHALAAMDAAESARLLDDVRVARASEDVAAVALRVPRAWTGTVEWHLTLRDEGGRRTNAEGRSAARAVACRLAAGRLEPGYYEIAVTLRHGDDERQATQSLIIVPDACPRVRDVLRRGRGYGLIANLYTVRAPHDYGVGDLTTLGALLEWAGELGCDFVGVNPLHALRSRGFDVSPYSPVSRLFGNPLYIDIDAVPELANCTEAHRILEWVSTRAELAELRAAPRVDYGRVATLKRRLLEALHRTFVSEHGDAASARGRDYLRWVEEQGEPLTLFATWAALEDHFTGEREQPVTWRDWPEAYRDPRSPEVTVFREANLQPVDFHRWLQFELARQLGAAAARGRQAGLAIGLYQDLAIGSAHGSADTWMFRDLFVRGVAVGAPPDPYSAAGQNWGLPPLDPRALRRDRYRHWIALLRAAFRHAGALRIDHVMGLFRQFWIPDGMSGEQGAYVRFPASDLLGILALEATRAGAIVVGEDLGTVPEEVPPALRAWGVLSSDVLYFEREPGGGFAPASGYAEDALTTANTHDMPTIAAWWEGDDIALRERVGLIDAEGARRERDARADERRWLVRRLAEAGALDRESDDDLGAAAIRAAVHRFLCRTPAALVGISLDDLALEREPVNVPGVPLDRYPSWTRRLTLSLPQLRDSREVHDALAGCDGRRRRP
jgi:4-alpha-glucanotransferase